MARIIAFTLIHECIQKKSSQNKHEEKLILKKEKIYRKTKNLLIYSWNSLHIKIFFRKCKIFASKKILLNLGSLKLRVGNQFYYTKIELSLKNISQKIIFLPGI